MSDRVLWFLLGAGAIYLLAGRGGTGGVGGGINLSVGGNLGASIPPDQRWARPTVKDGVEGVWDPMGAPTWYKQVIPGSDGNMVFSGGGLN